MSYGIAYSDPYPINWASGKEYGLIFKAPVNYGLNKSLGGLVSDVTGLAHGWRELPKATGVGVRIIEGYIRIDAYANAWDPESAPGFAEVEISSAVLEIAISVQREPSGAFTARVYTNASPLTPIIEMNLSPATGNGSFSPSWSTLSTIMVGSFTEDEDDTPDLSSRTTTLLTHSNFSYPFENLIYKGDLVPPTGTVEHRGYTVSGNSGSSAGLFDGDVAYFKQLPSEEFVLHRVFSEGPLDRSIKGVFIPEFEVVDTYPGLIFDEDLFDVYDGDMELTSPSSLKSVSAFTNLGYWDLFNKDRDISQGISLPLKLSLKDDAVEQSITIGLFDDIFTHVDNGMQVHVYIYRDNDTAHVTSRLWDWNDLVTQVTIEIRQFSSGTSNGEMLLEVGVGKNGIFYIKLDGEVLDFPARNVNDLIHSHVGLVIQAELGDQDQIEALTADDTEIKDLERRIHNIYSLGGSSPLGNVHPGELFFFNEEGIPTPLIAWYPEQPGQ